VPGSRAAPGGRPGSIGRRILPLDEPGADGAGRFPASWAFPAGPALDRVAAGS